MSESEATDQFAVRAARRLLTMLHALDPRILPGPRATDPGAGRQS
jgi:hypothetical protein